MHLEVFLPSKNSDDFRRCFPDCNVSLSVLRDSEPVQKLGDDSEIKFPKKVLIEVGYENFSLCIACSRMKIFYFLCQLPLSVRLEKLALASDAINEYVQCVLKRAEWSDLEEFYQADNKDYTEITFSKDCLLLFRKPQQKCSFYLNKIESTSKDHSLILTGDVISELVDKWLSIEI